MSTLGTVGATLLTTILVLSYLFITARADARPWILRVKRFLADKPYQEDSYDAFAQRALRWILRTGAIFVIGYVAAVAFRHVGAAPDFWAGAFWVVIFTLIFGRQITELCVACTCYAIIAWAAKEARS